MPRTSSKRKGIVISNSTSGGESDVNTMQALDENRNRSEGENRRISISLGKDTVDTTLAVYDDAKDESADGGYNPDDQSDDDMEDDEN